MPDEMGELLSYSRTGDPLVPVVYYQRTHGIWSFHGQVNSFEGTF